MFLREAENCLALHHLNVVCAYEAGFAEGMFFLAMELYPVTIVAEVIILGEAQGALLSGRC